MKNSPVTTYCKGEFPEHIKKWIKDNRLERSYEFEEYWRAKNKNMILKKRRKEMRDKQNTYENMKKIDKLLEYLDRKDHIVQLTV